MRGKICFVVLLVLMVSGLVLTQTPPSTDCTANPGSEACQNPLYTDDKATYLFDLDASWPLEGGAPTDIGPSVFIGGETKGLLPDGSVTTEEDTFTSSDTVRETYVDSPGEAGTSDWALGTVESTSISIPGSTVDLNEHGNFLITSPYGGECGDGIPNTGDQVSCPEDHGTPKIIVLEDQPEPEADIEYEEAAGIWGFEPAGDAGPTPLEGDYTYVIDEGSENWIVSTSDGAHDSSYSGSPDIVRDLNGRIVEEKVDGARTEALSVTRQTFKRDTFDNVRPEDEIKDGTVSGWTGTDDANENITNSENYYTEYELTGWYNSNYLSSEFEREVLTTEEYTAPSTTNDQTLDVRLDYLEADGLSDPLAECSEQTEIGDCSSPTEKGCTFVTKTNYSGFTSGWTAYKWGEDSELRIEYVTYNLVQDPIWSDVNSRSEIFDNVDGMNSSDVKDAGYGYYSDTIDGYNGTGSNDPSVSFNEYKLVGPYDADHTGSGWFEAHRTESSVGKADGPDGGGDGILAYHENDGIQGSSEEVFERGFWNSDPDSYPDSIGDYVSEENLPDIECPGDTIRCVISIDVSTNKTGWGSESSEAQMRNESINISIK